ncbi:odorant receptor coreceptor [Anabrus simplex]|uniref:odorant receptor coreceptor n=1 Tax=Anabrus simplex TaxID=316456 RepID=UPI0035A2FA49
MQKYRGLVQDVWPVIRLMQMFGHFMFDYRDEYSCMWTTLRVSYSSVNALLIVIQFAFICINLIKEADDVNDLAANTITVLFFVHSITKLAYFALRTKSFYRTLATWNTSNSHPLFSESLARHNSMAVMKMKRLLILIIVGTVTSIIAWVVITIVADPTKEIQDPDNLNDTMFVEIPQLMVKSWYPWDARHGMPYFLTFIYQFYWLLMTLTQANLLDVLFCCWLIYACEQLVHLKDIMRPLMELSAALDTLVPHTTELFRAASAASTDQFNDQQESESVNIRSIYSNQRDFSGFQRNSAMALQSGTIGPNGLTKKQELLVRSAIKYWVERHKHVVRFVGNIGDTYGSALLLHMLTSTVTLTLLAYQATKIEAVDVYACSVLGYLFYTLAQVFLFCVFGNRLIEESSSVMEAAYSCHWYDGSEEAKTFVQIVCQQCQKSLSISGAKFFTVSLDLFASVRI